jgi:thiamine biosynthesis lipoprotein
MNVTRRRFLTISAAATLLSGVRYDEYRWAGRALGAETSLVFRAPKDMAEDTISSVLGLVERFENTFSIYRHTSEISTLNQAAYIKPSKLFFELAGYVDDIYRNSNGYFDPTIQSVWGQTHDLINDQRWQNVTLTHDRITLPKNTQISFNGIAQGFLTDLVAAHLRTLGFSNVLVNFGEFKGIGGPWNVGLLQPSGLKSIKLNNTAIATSSPDAMRQSSGRSHMINPFGSEDIEYKSVSVEHHSAMIADALSTAFVFMSPDKIQNVISKSYPNSRVHLITKDEQMISLNA